MKYKFLISMLILVIYPLNVLSKTLVLNTTFPLSKNGLKWHQAEKIVTQAFTEIGFDMSITDLPPARALAMANSGEIDGDYLRVASTSQVYDNLIQVPSAIESYQLVAFTTRDNITLPKGMASLKNYHVGYLLGWKHVEKITSHLLSTQAITKPDTLFSMLSQQRFDLVIFVKRHGEKIISDLNLHNIRQIETILDAQEMYILLNKKHIGLVPELIQALDRVKIQLGTNF